MPKIISPGELEKDQYITILDYTSSNSNGDGKSWKNTKVKNLEHTFPGHAGKVFQIVHVELPFVITKLYHSPKIISNITIDTRTVNLMELSKEFVDAALM